MENSCLNSGLCMDHILRKFHHVNSNTVQAVSSIGDVNWLKLRTVL